MTINDVTMSAVFGTNAGIFAGNAIPSGVTSSSNKVIVIPLATAHAKAILSTIKLVNATLTEADYDSASDAIALINAALYAYTQINAKPTDLRKFAVDYLGLSLDSYSFETSKNFVVRQLQVALYQEDTAIVDSYNPSINTLI